MGDRARVPAPVTAVQAAAAGLAGITATDIVAALEIGADDVVLVPGATGGSEPSSCSSPPRAARASSPWRAVFPGV